jgi:hypothetical protein
VLPIAVGSLDLSFFNSFLQVSKPVVECVRPWTHSLNFTVRTKDNVVGLLLVSNMSTGISLLHVHV